MLILYYVVSFLHSALRIYTYQDDGCHILHVHIYMQVSRVCNIKQEKHALNTVIQ